MQEEVLVHSNHRNKSTKYTIDIQEVLDYNFCPQLYNLKYNILKTQNITDEYDKAIKQCFYSYLNMMKNNSSVEINYLMRLWGKYWINEKSIVKLATKASANSRDRYDVLRKQGIDGLISFHNMIKEGEQYPILVNHKYKIELTDNIILTGVFEYIREFKLKDDKHIFQIIKFNHRKDRFQTTFQMSHDLELTASEFAFKQIFNTTNQEVIYAYIYKEKFIKSFRNEKDYDILKQTVINTVKCIKNNIYSISPSSKCFQCSYRNQCNNYI